MAATTGSPLPVGISENLALFTRPPVDCGISKIEFAEYAPSGSLSDFSAVDFLINDSNVEYISLSQSRLYLKTQITKIDGTHLTSSDKVGLVNIPLHSFWRQVEVTLQETVVTNGVSTNYPYKCYFDILTSFGSGAKATQLEAALYVKDTAGAMDVTDPAGVNQGLKARAHYTALSAIVDMEGPLMFDMAQQERLIPNNIKIRIKLYPTLDSFRLMTNRPGVYKTNLISAVLKVCKVTVTPEIVLAHSYALQKSPALYPHIKSDVKTCTLSSGLSEWSTDDLFAGEVPQRLIVGLLDMRAYSGDSQFNPFNFQNFQTNYLSFTVSGVSLPGQPFQPDYPNNYVTAYLSLFTGRDIYNKDKDNDIKRREFPFGYTVYMFDIDGNSSCEYIKRPKYGHTRLSIRFGTPLPHAVTVVCYGTFGATLLIDKVRNISYENEKGIYALNYRTFDATAPLPGDESPLQLTDGEIARIKRKRAKRASRASGQ